jgi:hypothetical protein
VPSPETDKHRPNPAAGPLSTAADAAMLPANVRELAVRQKE